MRGAAALYLVLLGLISAPAFATDTVYYYHTDALRSEVVITNASHAVVERTYYGPYGEVLNRSLRDGPGYTGHEEDAATGLDNMQQRYYDPINGRFPSPDPMEVDTTTGANFNRYAYATDNPYRYVDPDGRGNLSSETKGQSCTGSHLPGSCTGATPVKVTQIAGLTATQEKKLASEMASENAADRVSAAQAAMRYFGIKPAGGTLEIHYDPTMDPQTYGSTVYDPSQPGHGDVTLGPSAYMSWAHLGSTLGHEIEVHWNQQMLPSLRNSIGTHERDRWEMQAYQYNIDNAKRFGNSANDIKEFHNLYNSYEFDLNNRPDSVQAVTH